MLSKWGLQSGGSASRTGQSALALTLLASACFSAYATPAIAQEESETEIVVYATKRGAQAVQDVPLAITAFSGEALENSFATDIESLSYSIPNVSLDRLGPPGFANFTIRGLGSNSSIPSLDPAVGTFVDGIYMGTNAGMIQDFINLESIEVLRGPQGVLFGKNVVGGAVMLRTRRPGEDFLVRTKASVNSWPGALLAGSVEGGLADGLSASITGYYSDDDGPYENITIGRDVGDMTTWFVRPAFYYENDAFNAYLTMDYGENYGDGPPQLGIQTVAALTDEDWVVAGNSMCCTDTSWRSATVEVNADVDFGDGTITYLTGWRRTDSMTLTDVDSGPTTGFNLQGNTRATQNSHELRYAGTFGNVDVTTGVYYFEQNLDYVEVRQFGAVLTAFGGDVRTESTAAFANLDLHMTDTVTLSGGLRYTREEKAANIAPQAAPLGVAPSQCNVVTLACNITFSDSNTSTGLSPRVALNWEPAENLLFYGSWGEGLRSGGYNLRHTSPTVTPRVTDDEEVSNFEIGAKTQFLDRRLTVNAALFNTTIDNILRDTVVFVDGVGFVQLNQNAGDVVVRGVELELQAAPTDNLNLFASVGWQENEWQDVFLDITGDTVIDQRDYALILPRLAEWTTMVGANYRIPTDAGDFTLRGTYSYRSEAPYPDNNTAFMPEVHLVDASLSWEPRTGLVFSLWGKNLLDDVIYTSNTYAGAAFQNIAYLGPPRQIGFEIRAEF